MRDETLTVTKKKTDAISPTFCLAKWHQVTIHLQLGKTHSCHHPVPHDIPLEEVKKNPSAIHNTNFKKEQRRKMLAGQRPKECSYCWRIEDLGPEYMSDRHIKNSYIMTPENMAAVREQPTDYDVNPDFVELSFSNLCNFKCGYCHPRNSSTFLSEVKKHGIVRDVFSHDIKLDGMKIYEEDENPYLKAWWEWWPSLKKDIKSLRLTGGEPLMHKSTWRLLDQLKEEPIPRLRLNTNSNLGIPNKTVQKFSEQIRELVVDKKIKSHILYTSIDTWGPQAEYIRTGLNLDLWEKNLDTYVRTAKSYVTLMVTFNALSLVHLKDLLKKILQWRQRYEEVIEKELRNHHPKFSFDLPYLYAPLLYNVKVLPPKQFLPYLYECRDFISENLDEDDPYKFKNFELKKIERAIGYMSSEPFTKSVLKATRKDFYRWFSELDKRRDTNFCETFPEYKEFFEACSKL